MPYVEDWIREQMDEHLMRVPYVDGPGTLNYAITKLCLRYLICNGLGYRSLNDVVGVLECAKQELYRRVAAPYEDKKCNENGDVYDIGN